ncbi:MAG TPA: hypothetical protein VD791_01770 [Burkholderiales bacterium]|nr:hypothetical protein [Burkholderiales bacterium]
MKFDAPHGSVFGGYGFWSYSAAPNSQPSAGNSGPSAGTSPERGSLSLRWLLDHARRMLRRTSA